MINRRNGPESMQYNPLEAQYATYVSDAYDAGEFAFPEITLHGETEDYFDSEGDSGYVTICRQIGETAVKEILNGVTITYLNEDELVFTETPASILVIEKGKDIQIIAK